MRRVMLAALLLVVATNLAQADSITRYCGGGVTGGGGGVRLSDDDSVMRFRRPRPGPVVEETPLGSHPGSYARIAAMLTAAGFERLRRGEPSNMTCSITWQRDGKSQLVMWSIGSPPAALQPVLRELEAFGR
jgi:hypothetical protein